MKRLLTLILILSAMLGMLWLKRAAAQAGGAAATADKVAVDAQTQLRFVPVDVVLDTGIRPLGAYQLEIQAKNAMIVGLEGGDPESFKPAPYYDPAALHSGNRIIVAAFSTAEKLPTGAIRVARLHLALNDAKELPNIESKLVVVTDSQGHPILAKLELRPLGDPR